MLKHKYSGKCQMITPEGMIYEADFSGGYDYLPRNGKWKGIYKDRNSLDLYGA
jgi:hypothetical protein